MKIVKVIFLLYALLASSCNPKNTTPGSVETIDILETLKNPGTIRLSELGTEAELVQFESVNPDAFFSNPRSLVVGRNYILISDDQTNKVYLFERNGRFVRLIGRTGKGPGEFMQAWVAGMDPHERFIFVVDDMQRKLIRYDLEGTFLNEISTKDLIPGWFCDGMIFPDDDHLALLARYPVSAVDKNSRVLVFDLDLQLTGRIRTSTEEEGQVLPYLIYATLERLNDKMLFWETCFDTVWYFYPDGREVPAYHLLITRNPVPVEFVKTLPQPGQAREDFNRIYGVRETPQYLFITGQAGKVFNIAYNKKTKEAIALENPVNCDTSGSMRPSIENDLFGIEPVHFKSIDFDQNLLVMGARPAWIQQTNDIECIKRKKVAYPELRDEFLRIAEQANFEDYLLVLIRMK